LLVNRLCCIADVLEFDSCDYIRTVPKLSRLGPIRTQRGVKTVCNIKTISLKVFFA